ncbi:MAG: hypothetical protein KCHDKBKB_02561 [Elusimicrobia bacterium]|nr:hypothetical protein [Elusimicrobiota bacterium]
MEVEQKSGRVFDLEDRTFSYAKNVRSFLSKLKSNQSNFEDKKQLMRSSGSVAANYIEANEAVSTKDFLLRMKISKKEAKESLLWLRLIDCENNQELILEQKRLIQETEELGKIFGSIINKFRQ